MSEKLYIKNFAGIKEMELDIGEINILIGPQASGKSVCAKLLYYFKNFRKYFLEMVVKKQTKEAFNEGLEKRFREMFSVNVDAEPFAIRYSLEDSGNKHKIRIENRNGIIISYSKSYETALNECLKVINTFNNPENGKKRWDFPGHLYDRFPEEFITELEFIFNTDEILKEQIYIPAKRSIHYTIQGNIFSLLSENQNIDLEVKEFGRTIEQLRREFIYYLEKLPDNATDFMPKLLSGNYFKDKDNQEFIKHHDGRIVPIMKASSGQQALLPLIQTLLWNMDVELPVSGRTIYIEEPESNIFPTAQKMLIELIGLLFNHQHLIQFVIATHSPYILTSFNNLIQAGITDAKLNGKNKDKLHKIVDPQKYLNPKQFRVYSLEDGIIKQIEGRSNCINEYGLIDGDLIDEVSDILSQEFSDMLDLEFSNEDN